jgi:hypothetical protein
VYGSVGSLAGPEKPEEYEALDDRNGVTVYVYNCLLGNEHRVDVTFSFGMLGSCTPVSARNPPLYPLSSPGQVEERRAGDRPTQWHVSVVLSEYRGAAGTAHLSLRRVLYSEQSDQAGRHHQALSLKRAMATTFMPIESAQTRATPKPL